MKKINKKDMVLIGVIIIIALVATIIIIIPKNSKNSINNNETNEQNEIKGIKVNSVDENVLHNLPIDTTPLEILNQTTNNQTGTNNDIVVSTEQ